MQQVLRALMHVISPLVNGQGAPAASPAATSVPQEGRAAPSVTPPAAATAADAAVAAAPSDNSVGRNRPAAQRPLGMSEPLSEMIGGAGLGDAGAGVAEQGAVGQDLVNMLMGAGASSVNVSGPMAMPTQHPEATAAATAATSGASPLPTAASQPPAGVETTAAAQSDQPVSKPAAAPPAAASGSGGTRTNRGAMGLGSALPPREKGGKKSHPRSPVPVASAEEAAGGRQAGGRPGPSNPQQDNVKRARHGDSNDASSTSTAERAASSSAADGQPAGLAQAGMEAEEILRPPPRGAMQADSAGGLDAMLAQMFGGGGGAPGGAGSTGLNLNSLAQVCPAPVLQPPPLLWSLVHCHARLSDQY